MSPRLVCTYCGRGCQYFDGETFKQTPKNAYTEDHVFPRQERKLMKMVAGWRWSELYHTVPSCFDCNNKRGSTPFLQFLGY